jgi:subtilisin family serine protease
MRRYVTAFAFLVATMVSFADNKVVRLRNEHIQTTEKAQRKSAEKNQPDASAHSGLFLLQFEGPMQPAWSAELQQRGVKLVRYVPDHAYIARASGVKLREIEDLPYVRWTGPFRPEHKVLGGLRNKAANGDLAVSILLAPDSSPAQLGSARGLMKKLSSQSSSRFGHVWRGEISRAQLDQLAASDAVLWIERAANMKLFDETASKIVGGESPGHATYVQSVGYDGSGVVVSVADSGLHAGEAATMHPDLFGRVDAFLFYGSTLSDAADEHSHGTHVAGIVAGNGATGTTDDYGALWGLGVAPGAHLVVQRLFDAEGGYTPDGLFTFEQLTRDATDAGADIGSNSWGDDTQGRYDLSAHDFDILVRDANAFAPGDQPYILEFSAGNAGPGAQTIGSPAVAKNVIATGASQNNRFDYFIYDFGQEAMADFSSRGPAEDGRIKPDLIAPGTWISSLRSPLGNDEFAWAEIDNDYLFQGGTSQAGPHVSGAAAVFVQWYRESHTNATPSPALVKAALINSAADMDDTVETGPVPNNDEGWGRVDLAQIIGSDRSFDFVDQAVSLATGQQFERHVVVVDDTLPLFVTLAYTDVPAFPGALPALVNDLDLEVVAPDGQIYRGNQFLDGDSIPNSPAVDRLNNVECVFIGEPIPGQYTVRVRAFNVPQDARTDTVATDQDFALVVSAHLPAPGTSFVFFDRRAYRAPDNILVKVIDPDLAGPSINLTVRSTSQPSGVVLTLISSGLPGTFTGSVATVTATTPNRLRIAHNDSITTDYFDASAGVTRTATARGDLFPPVITGVGTSNSFGKIIVFWQTDEPANSIVRYGTNSSLNLGATNGLLVTGHSVSLSDLIAGRTYFFSVVSVDEAGNRATNNNGGALFSFVAATAPTVLLVENYQSDGFGAGPDIPLSVYTDTLNQLGVSYVVWDMVGDNPQPSPTIDDLRPFRIVIWRVSDNVFINNTLSAPEQAAVQQFVQGGGSFLMSSMEQLTRLSAGFISGVLQVASVGVDETAPSANGIPGNVITGGGISLPLDYSNYETEFYVLAEIPPDISDTMTPTTNAFPILTESSGGIVGIAYPKLGLDRTGRVVFLSFPLDAVSSTVAAPNNRATLMQRILNFLAPGQEGIGSITLDNSEFTLPSLATIEVGDLDLAGAGQVSITVSSTTEPTPRTFVLPEFGRFGIFRGTLPILSSHADDPAHELVAANGDTILASYFDASRNVSVTFTARVETIPPIISGHTVEPDFVSTSMYWETSELCDALVQFGESTFLSRTAYLPALETTHALVLEGLQPARRYYYRIVSRDNAGNVAVLPEGDAYYTFDTLTPINAPWSDDMESGDAGWSVFTPDESEASWQHGVPQNGVAAHSGTHVWASNLNGESTGFVESFLISPAVYLTGGNRATLRFWHNYDFTLGEDDILHFGEVSIITNVSGQPIVLDTIEDFASGDWEEAEYDLTPYSGQLVYIVWHYVLFSLDNTPKLGWVVDDVSIDVSTVVAGTLRVTNNLSQASFSIAGPLNITGQGNSFVTTNAPPGSYTVAWGAVADWNTPAPQAKSVVALGTTTFTGNYTITDTNNNGMADSWERTYFGSAAANHTALIDTDHDGATDYAEFLAGTNPTNATSALHFFTPAVQNTGAVRFDWPAIPGRSYRMTSSDSSLTNWVPAAEWVRANGNVLSFTTNVTSGTRFYRIEARP